MDASEPSLRTLRELAEEAGVPPRTIRFYISRGLLPGPRTAGRGASYDEEHLERLRKIRELQEQGLTLSAIAHALEAGGETAPGLPQPATWNSYALQDDVVVLVRGDADPWRVKQIRAAMQQFADQIRALNQGG